MKAMRCDRCGLFYLKNEIIPKGQPSDCCIDGVDITFHNRNGRFDKYKRYDLCDECIIKFMDFMESPEKDRSHAN